MNRRCPTSRPVLFPGRLVHSLVITAAMGAMVAIIAPGGCLVTEHCYSDADCDAPKICLGNGSCGYECEVDLDCGEGLRCLNHRCHAASVTPIVCPDDMVNVGNAFCVDRFEASRPDATEQNYGKDDSQATSRFGVMPWRLGFNENGVAREACLAAEKDLCTPMQWRIACQGTAQTVYGYGDVYEPQTCNGIDTFGLDNFQLLPTGNLPGCVNDWGVFDMNGNLWEHTLGGDDTTIRGGAYNCKDSQTLHRCDYVPGNWTPTAHGFRCCLVPDDAPDAGIPDATVADVSEDGEGGCLDEDGGPDVSTDVVYDVTIDTSIGDAGSCPADMVLIESFCMDIHEASRIDATESAFGMIPVASSRENVLPWMPVDLPMARAGCEAAGKRLCELDEWVTGCGGPDGTIYAYGDTYSTTICNGIDTYCDCSGTCAGVTPCPYPHCYNESAPGGGGPCGASPHVTPTGAFPNCTNEYGVFDINGNVWELANSDDGLEHFRGGAYNCIDSERLHRCDHDGTWGPTARGFRCCRDPE